MRLEGRSLGGAPASEGVRAKEGIKGGLRSLVVHCALLAHSLNPSDCIAEAISPPVIEGIAEYER